MAKHASSADPYNDWPQPTAAQCTAVVERLAALHGMPKRRSTGRTTGEGTGIVEALIRTILSQNTTNQNSSRAMANLMTRYDGDYDAVRRAPLAEVVESIACGGLANVKGQRIQRILAEIHAQQGEVSLEHLRHLPDAEVTEALMRFSGVGPKTASCVLLFCLGRDSFAVDTHVFRIAKKLGWLPDRANREGAYVHLDARVPAQLKYPLHVLLIRHGKSCYACAAQGRPQVAPAGPCPL